MGKEKNTPPASSTPFGDVNVIREILMGQHISQFEHRFEENEDNLSRTEEALRNRIQQLEQDMNARFERIEQLLNTHVQNLSHLIRETSTADKAGLAGLLDEISRKLKEG